MQGPSPFLVLAIAGVLAFAEPQAVLPQEITPASSSPVTKAWTTLKDGVADKDVKHRNNAVAAVGTIGSDPQAVHVVEKALQDKDQQVRQTAAATLGDVKSKDAIPYLTAALDDTPEVSFTATKSLWDLGDTTGRGIFEEVIEGDRSNAPGKLQRAVAEAKRKLTPGQLAAMGAGEVFAPASIGIDAVREAVKSAKNDTGAGGRRIAAEVLAKDPDPYALTLLEWALGNDNWGVRVAVAKAVGERGNEASITKPEPLLQDDHYEVRYMAAASMVKLSLKDHALPSD